MATTTETTETTATPEAKFEFKPRRMLVKTQPGGQITIPSQFREALGIEDEMLLQLSLEDGALRVTLADAEENRGSPWLRELYDYFAPVREEILARGISEEEVNADIDAAIAEVRAEQRARQK
jgi:bifunctional DNA-binding transcriptional regulator/antitoxin component of YhaV-PrlF toxin-antitoxin module